MLQLTPFDSPPDFRPFRQGHRPFSTRAGRNQLFADESLLQTYTPDSSLEALRRFLHPEEYPCYDLEGVYKYTPGCRGRCCFTVGTPDGEDTPKWKETLAARQVDAPPMAQQEGESPLAVNMQSALPASWSSP